MNIQTYMNLHSTADRLALEAARKTVIENEEERYIRIYKKAMDFLLKEFTANKRAYFPKRNNEETD